MIAAIKNQYGEKYDIRQIQMVWFSHILGSKKAILIDSGKNNRIYEVTYNSKKDELYIDTYEKQVNVLTTDIDTKVKEQTKEMNENTAKLSPPWVTYANELKALFGNDPEIRIEYDNDTLTVNMYIDNQRKADAIGVLIPAVKSFGNVELHINIVPANIRNNYAGVLTAAFAGNPAVRNVSSIGTPFGDMCYVICKKEVVQFWNDQMDDINGNKSTLYQEIMRDLFGNLSGVCFCTSDKDD